MGLSTTTGSERTSAPAGIQRATEWLAISVFAVLSMFVLLKVAWGVAVNGWMWTGALGYVFDTMQYLAWIREMGDHFLAGNLFSLAPVERNYFNPGLGISALLYRLGVPIPIAYALWVPVGIIAMVAATIAYVRRMVEPGWPQVAAIALALLFKLPVVWLLEGRVPKEFVNASTYASWDAWPVNWAWGFSLTAVAVALLCAGLIRYSTDRSRNSAFSPLLAATALVCSWLQPWQGSQLLAIIIGSELLALVLLGKADRGNLRRRWTLIATTAIAGILPLVYYAILGELDDSWRINGIQANHYVRGVSWWTGPFVLGPLLLGALFALRARPRDFGQVALRIWPAVALVQLAVIDATGIGNTATHALKGITIPLAVLAVTGLAPWVRRIGSPRVAAGLAAAAIVLVTAPGAWNQVASQSGEMNWPGGRGGYFITKPDQDAIDLIDRSQVPGAVIGASAITTQVPWQTGRQVWLGHETWTPRFQGRSYFMEVMLGGGLPYWTPPTDTAEFLGWTRVRFLIDDCSHARIRDRRARWELGVARKRKRKPLLVMPLGRQIASVTRSATRFDCATVYELKPPGANPVTPANIGRYRLEWSDSLYR